MRQERIHTVAVTAVAAAMRVASQVGATTAYADITTGDGTVIHGYTPSEMISTDVEVTDGTVENLGPALAQKIVEATMMALPVLAALSVGVIIYNAIRNMFLPDEDPKEAARKGHKPKRPMGEVIKSVFAMFFWILFAWLIVELIIWGVTKMEILATTSLTSGGTQG